MKTTIHIDKQLLEYLNTLSEKYEMTRTEIIKRSMAKLIVNNMNSSLKMNLIEYQKVRKKDDWHNFHISFCEAEYEQYFDLKKVLKKSVSLLVSFAVSRYAEIICNIDDNDGDNYRLLAYTGITKCNEKVHGYEFYWGIPDKEDIKRLKLEKMRL